MAQQKRPPVITIMGHVDHGKTTLLDYIRKTNVTAKEAGGITQHIGAYNIDYNGTSLTFIDTPGHAAFNKMRERGSQITDLVILVVAANDGVKPQTIESIRHIKASNVPVIVAVNKMDLPDVNPDIAKSQLAEHGIMVSEYGGDVETVEISALKGKGVDKLLETIILMADILELTSDQQAPMEAVVVESEKDARRGVVATVIVQKGTLSVRQDVYTDTVDGRVKLLTNEQGDQISDVLPGYPAEIIGFKDVPSVGSIVRDSSAEYPDVEVAEKEIEEIEKNPWGDIDFGAMLEAKPKLKLLIKADTEGTLEAIMQTIDDESTDVLDFGIGEITERDIEMARTSDALLIAFHIKVSNKIKKLAKEEKVRIRVYDIIYKLIEDLQKQQLKLLEPTIDEVVHGEIEILQIFEMKGEHIAGCRVKTGELKKRDLLHLKRGDEIIADPKIKSMLHGKEEIDSVTAKSEFGCTFHNKKLDFQVGDMLIAYTIEDDI
ncbi:MAG: translation initiation factor IF-2 [Candidatus Pacebacteria bacterium]|nr:translation initiation factor IF-2 [Candidatus Paceibacterota bacterium]PIR63666.1 MAG: translation initiation factor IF-2 [Candidatus Pacebacteria bacterium CG10_big_fil_rev_8_21_14_0_10_40_26]PIZ78769.1 MAG: translation initiation factor IF-2 [Candidatus Pacebacteria bacterium CG_4_10_14_0_2_um_filter_40_20]PJA68380.1 MAG: translation initiation factor IF-2 [Candidatus Pacebacteria bacterium CG_4_9_14_3_um_filter_40_12]PJC41242.1 MAG: translation initiation factor IF-2 [Candidatus Pacebact